MASIIPKELKEALYHGSEEPNLEYKGNSSWGIRSHQLKVIKTIFALANERDGGLIIIGVDDDGTLIGLDDDNFNSYSHDDINRLIEGRGNQTINCKVTKKEHNDHISGQLKKFVFIQVEGTSEYPAVYTGPAELEDALKGTRMSNVILRPGALYIRNKADVGNKEIQTTQEWKSLVELTLKKYSTETVRRSVFTQSLQDQNPYEEEISI